MSLPFGAFRFSVVAFAASLLLGLQAVRHDDPAHDSPPFGLAQLNSSGKDMTIDDCNALLYTIMASTDLISKGEVMLSIRTALFHQNGMDVLADFLTDGLYTIELDQARHTGGKHIGRNTLTVVNERETDYLYSGAFVIGGQTFGWLAKKDGLFYWHSGIAQRPKLHIGGDALSGSCFLIVGCAFIAQALRPFSTEPFYDDALAILDSATLLTGSGRLKITSKVADLIMGDSFVKMRDMFIRMCPDILRLSIGDVISAVGPPPKNPPPPEPEAALQSKGRWSQNKTIRLTIHGI
jgi:hypothetical protein